MRYLHHLQSRVTPLLSFYIETLKEAFDDINNFVDTKLESELGTIIAIATIIAAPIAGTMIFVSVLSAI